jgi:hypothetical protein
MHRNTRKTRVLRQRAIVGTAWHSLCACRRRDGTRNHARVIIGDIMRKAMTTKQIWAARGIALGADALQMVLFPLFAGGVPEGADAVLDVLVGVALVWLCGFHPAFLPTFIGEALPTVDLFPSWTLAVLFVTRARSLPAATDVPRELP